MSLNPYGNCESVNLCCNSHIRHIERWTPLIVSLDRQHDAFPITRVKLFRSNIHGLRCCEWLWFSFSLTQTFSRVFFAMHFCVDCLILHVVRFGPFIDLVIMTMQCKYVWQCKMRYNAGESLFEDCDNFLSSFSDFIRIHSGSILPGRTCK